MSLEGRGERIGRSMGNDGRNQRRDRWPGFDLGGGGGQGGSGGPGADRARRVRMGLWLIVGLFVLLYLFNFLGGGAGKEINFSAFQKLVREHKVTNVKVS